ncbi:nascent polypeptide-associated complex protein [Candidatus Woesearchaeota archaeon]|nr:nascent polypeptide-associated complex protein [Candidatus Woesearchaeota archaeon]
MIPGMNPRMMKQAMKKMGIKQEEIDSNEVIIRCPDKEIVISPASVQKVNMMGQETFQVSGDISERELSIEPEISDDDIQTVVDQTGVSKEKAIEAIEASKGDLAIAIMNLQKEGED